MSKRNNPRAAPAPPPRYANDPTGFWSANARANAANWAGIATPEADRFELAKILQRAIEWMKITVRWNDITFPASLDDGQIGAPLENGGLGVTGSITLVFSKSLFASNSWPGQHDMLQISVKDEWKNFRVLSISEGFDMADDALIAILEPEDSE